MADKSPTSAQPNTINQRLEWFMHNMLAGSEIPKMYHGVILNLARGYFVKANEDDARRILIEIKDTVLPWLLYGDPKNPPAQ